MGINRVNISGNLTRDPELRQAGQTPVLALGVAVSDRRRNQQTGGWEDVPNFVDCVLFGARAEALAQHLSKGAKVAIEGRLRYSSWEGKDGQRRSKLEVVVDEVEFMSPRGQQAPQQHQQYQQPQAPQQYQQQPRYPQAAPAPQPPYQPPLPQPQPAYQYPPVEGAYDEDIPF